MTRTNTRIVLAHSGGLDTSIAIPWLAEHHDAEVVAVTLDLGQESDLTELREAALAAGAVRAHVIDARGDFVAEYALRSLQAGALHAGTDPQPAALGRAIVAARLVDVAGMESATAIAYGPGLEPWIRTLAPKVPAIPASTPWGLSRADKLAYARARRVHLVDAAEGPAGYTANLWGRSRPRGVPGDTQSLWHADGHALTRSPDECPNEPAIIEIEFDAGIPVRANGIEMPLPEMIESVTIIAGAHGVGRIEHPEATAPDLDCEAPAAVVLHAAHGALQSQVVPHDLDHVARQLARDYAALIRDGRWFSPLREALDAFVRTIQPRVAGSVRLKLFKGQCCVVECRPRHTSERDSQGTPHRLEPAVEGLSS